MIKLTESEWTLLNVLWTGTQFSLGEVTDALKPLLNWHSKTVYTYLTRMKAKGVVTIDRNHAQPYSAALSREDCAKQERTALLNKVYRGHTGDLLAAFLRESTISPQERDRLRKLLDDMEV